MRRSKVLTAVRERDLAVAYGAIVFVTGLVLVSAPGSLTDSLVRDTSTNLTNLHQHPVYVLIVSAFIEPSASELWLVVPLVVACGAVQRWLGRLATVITLVLGHVGATLFVATVLSAGIAHGAISRSVAHASDVGVSYALVGVAGLLAARVDKRWAKAYVIALTAYFLAQLFISATFTDLGHVTAWLIGLSLAVLVHQAHGPGDPH